MLLCFGILGLCAGCGKSPDGKAGKAQFEIDKDYERGPLTSPDAEGRQSARKLRHS
jgi:hypothetical protein